MSQVYRFPWATREDAQVWIVHFGSKSTPLIAQLCRELGLQSRTLLAPDLPDQYQKASTKPKLVILSGGEQSVYAQDALSMPQELFRQLERESHVFGICYGAQLAALLAGGRVAAAALPEYGQVHVESWMNHYQGGTAVMNHGDEITELPEGWKVLASTERCRNAIVGTDRVVAVQFHPEMDHTVGGEALLAEVALRAGCERDYTFDPAEFVQQARTWLAGVLPGKPLLCGLSGGVDSAVAFTIAQGRAHGIFVDNGFMRAGEMEEVRAWFGDEHVTYEDASDRFYRLVEGIPYGSNLHPTLAEHMYYEMVRKVVGSTFIDVFVETARRLGISIEGLMQGTNAGDIIESLTGLKAHHNVTGLPDRLHVSIIEPLAGLFKFEIRKLALYLGLRPEVVNRQPFPGPGLSIRAWGPLRRDMVKPMQQANRILDELVVKHYPRFEDRPCQYYVALLPAPNTGLMGDGRVSGYIWWVRMVTAGARESYSTVGVFRMSEAFQDELAHRLTSEVRMEDGTRFSRVGYEITGKPPSTTEPH